MEMSFFPRQAGEIGSGEEDTASTEERYWFPALEYGVYYPVIWGLVAAVIILLVCCIISCVCCIFYCRRQKKEDVKDERLEKRLRRIESSLHIENGLREDVKRAEDNDPLSQQRNYGGKGDQRYSPNSSEQEVRLQEEGGPRTSTPVNPAANPVTPAASDSNIQGVDDASGQEPSNRTQALQPAGAKHETAAEVFMYDPPPTDPSPAARTPRKKPSSSSTSESPKRESGYNTLPAAYEAGGLMAVSPPASKSLERSQKTTSSLEEQADFVAQASPTSDNQSPGLPQLRKPPSKQKAPTELLRRFSAETSCDTAPITVSVRPTSENVEAKMNGAQLSVQKRPHSDNITSGTQHQETEHNGTSSLVGARKQYTKRYSQSDTLEDTEESAV